MLSEIQEFISRYYVDPIVNDSGYNIVNTLTWALILGICLIGIFKVFKHLRITIDQRFTAGVVCYVLFGSSLRVLEDADIFTPPLQYLFITPIIYFVVFFVTVAALLLSVKIYGSRYHLPFAAIGLGLSSVNIIMLLGSHLFDASSTMVGIDRLGYHGKHVVENYLVDLTGTGAVMYPLKLIVFIPLLYLIDSEFDEIELADLLKLVILVLGLSPACRNTIRILFGV
jgi:uncharacterized membrane protein